MTMTQYPEADKAHKAVAGGGKAARAILHQCLMCSFFPFDACVFSDSSHAAADGSFSSRREICLTLEGEIFVRYQSYKVTTPSPWLLPARALLETAPQQQHIMRMIRQDVAFPPFPSISLHFPPTAAYHAHDTPGRGLPSISF
jgi:hypothetical protein